VSGEEGQGTEKPDESIMQSLKSLKRLMGVVVERKMS
jgi:hypothetical protein